MYTYMHLVSRVTKRKKCQFLFCQAGRAVIVIVFLIRSKEEAF